MLELHLYPDSGVDKLIEDLFNMQARMREGDEWLAATAEFSQHHGDHAYRPLAVSEQSEEYN